MITANIDACDPTVMDHGRLICVLEACRYRAEMWVRAVATLSGQDVDWHFAGGLVNVLYVGDYAAVLAAIKKLEPLLVNAMPRDPGECAACASTELHSPGRLWRVLGPDEDAAETDDNRAAGPVQPSPGATTSGVDLLLAYEAAAGETPVRNAAACHENGLRAIYGMGMKDAAAEISTLRTALAAETERRQSADALLASAEATEYYEPPTPLHCPWCRQATWPKLVHAPACPLLLYCLKYDAGDLHKPEAQGQGSHEPT